jgi:hypothetical protein
MASPNSPTSQQSECENRDVCSPKYSSDCPCDYCQRAATQEIIHIAALLNRKLPPDIIPTIPEYANIHRRLILPEVNPMRCNEGFIIPKQILPGSVRKIEVWTGGGKLWDHQTPDEEDEDEDTDIPDEEQAWIEAVITDFDGDAIHKEAHSSVTQQQAPHTTTTLQPSSPKHRSKRLVTYTNNDVWLQAPNEFESSWTLESDDPDVRQIMKEIRGGSVIRIYGWQRPGLNFLYNTVTMITIEYAVVTKM